MLSVLLLETGTQGLAMAHALKKAGHRVLILYGEKYNYADMSRYVDEKYLTSAHPGSDAYLEKVMQIAKDVQIDAIIPMSDATADFLSKNKEPLKQLTHFHCPDYSNFLQGYDKNRLLKLCATKGYPHPLTIDLSDVVDIENNSEIKNFPYPAMLKPNCTTGGRGMTIINSFDELTEKYPALRETYGEYHLQKFIPSGGKQIKVQLYVDERHKLVQSSVMEKIRWYPNKAGSNCCAISIKDDKNVNLCYNILKDLNWIGFADFDLIEDPQTHELLIMEINPRVPACIRIAIEAGVNWAEVIVNDSLGLPQEKYDYREGVFLRHLGLDVLWFTHAKNRWKCSPSWFKFFGNGIYYQDFSSWTDPLPFLMGTWHNIKKLFNPTFKEDKSL